MNHKHKIRKSSKITLPNIKDFVVGSPNVTKNITQEVYRECLKQNITIDKNFISYAINLFSFHPDNQFQFDQPIDHTKLQLFVKMCVKRFTDRNSISNKILEMQAKFMMNPINFEVIAQERRVEIESRLTQSVDEILESQIKNKDDYGKILRKIAIDVIAYNGLGNAANDIVMEETLHALNSLLSRLDILEYTKLDKIYKKNSLQDIREICCGVRIYNKDAKNCTTGVIDLPDLVEKSFQSSCSTLNVTKLEVNDRINLLTSALTYCWKYNETTQFYETMIPNHITSDEFNYIKDSLIFFYQQHEYIEYLHDHLEVIKTKMEKQIDTFRKILSDIHTTVLYKTAVPTEHVYPNFCNLGKMWINLQNTIFVISKVNQFNSYLADLTSSLDDVDSLVSKILDTNQSDETRANTTDSLDIGKLSNVVKFEERNTLQLHGFCFLALVEGKGLLLSGNPKLGVGVIQSKFYAFRDKRSVDIFSNNHENLYYNFMEFVKSKPELIIFLCIFEDVKNFKIPEQEEIVKTKVLINSQTQTDLHPKPFHKPKDYTSNVWDLRRQAIKLANLRKCSTTSAQTNLTYHKWDIRIQTYDPKSNSSQTRVETGTQLNPQKKVLANLKDENGTSISLKENYLIQDLDGVQFHCVKGIDKNINCRLDSQG